MTTTYHRRGVAAEMEDPEFRAEYERTRRELAQVNSVMACDRSAARRGRMVQGELARQLGKDDARIQRRFRPR